MVPLMGILSSAPRIIGKKVFLAAAILSSATLQARPMASSQAAVPSCPTGAEPTMARPALWNSRMEAV